MKGAGNPGRFLTTGQKPEGWLALHRGRVSGHSLYPEPEPPPRGRLPEKTCQVEIEGRWLWVGSLLQTQPQIPGGRLGLGLRLHAPGRPWGSHRALDVQLPSSKASAFLRCSKHRN